MAGNSFTDSFTNDLLSFDTETFTWTLMDAAHGVTGTPPSVRAFAGVTMFGQTLVVYGGRAYDSYDDASSHPVLADLHVFDTTSKQWTAPAASGDVPSARYLHTMSTLGDAILMVGGRDRGIDFSAGTFSQQPGFGVESIDNNAYVLEPVRENVQGVNLARACGPDGQDPCATAQSTTGTKDDLATLPGRAVDGDASTNPSGDSCAATQDQVAGPQWWMVDLGRVRNVSTLKLFNNQNAPARSVSRSRSLASSISLARFISLFSLLSLSLSVSLSPSLARSRSLSLALALSFSLSLFLSRSLFSLSLSAHA